jgi:hypothetical protein
VTKKKAKLNTIEVIKSDKISDKHTYDNTNMINNKDEITNTDHLNLIDNIVVNPQEKDSKDTVN